MLFWIFVGLTVIIASWTAIAMFDYIFEAVFGFFIGGILSGAVFGLILTVLYAIPGLHSVTHTQDETYSLRAVGTGSSVEGRIHGGIFVTSGYIEGKQIFSYVREDQTGGYVLRQADASDSVVYQGDYEPRVDVTTYTYGNPWIFPWETGSGYTAKFYVPEGSVANSYEVSPVG